MEDNLIFFHIKLDPRSNFFSIFHTLRGCNYHADKRILNQPPLFNFLYQFKGLITWRVFSPVDWAEISARPRDEILLKYRVRLYDKSFSAV